MRPVREISVLLGKTIIIFDSRNDNTVRKDIQIVENIEVFPRLQLKGGAFIIFVRFVYIKFT